MYSQNQIKHRGVKYQELENDRTPSTYIDLKDTVVAFD